MTNQLPPEGLIRYRVLLAVVGLSKSTVMRRIAAGTFPPPIALGARINTWNVADVREWLADPNGWRAQA